MPEDLRIDENYLAGAKSIDDIFAKLDRDLSRMPEGARIRLERPDRRLRSFYADAAAYVCGMAAKQGFTLIPSSEYDIDKIHAVLGRQNVIGNEKDGYRFRRVA